MHPRSLSRCRHGYVLVYFAMLTFVLMAVAALVVDVGFAFVTRRQMQTAVGSRRWRAYGFATASLPQWMDPTNPGQLDSSIITAMQGEGLDPSNSDNVRRWAAQQNVVNTFDDNLNPADGDPSNAVPYQGGPANFGPGPWWTSRIAPGSRPAARPSPPPRRSVRARRPSTSPPTRTGPFRSIRITTSRGTWSVGTTRSIHLELSAPSTSRLPGRELQPDRFPDRHDIARQFLPGADEAVE